MNTLGKILAVFNVLAAVGFIYLAAADWGRRQSWAYTVLLYEVRTRGIAVDGSEVNDTEHRPAVEVEEAALPDIFKGVGNPVSTQEQEVANVKTALTTVVTNASLAEEAKRKKLAAILIPLANTSGERDRLARLIATEPTDRLIKRQEGQAPFEEAFNRVSRATDLQAKRAAIADLLFGLGTKDAADSWARVDVPNPDPNKTPEQNKMMRCTKAPTPDPAWLQRVITIVGAREFAAAANRQALALRDMITPLRMSMEGDLGTFIEQHNTMVKLLRRLTAELKDQQAELAGRTAEAAKHQGLVANRKKDLEGLQEQLEETRKALKDALKQQNDLENALFDASQAVRDGQRTNERLEREIRKREDVGR
jgi:hypothetical protein